MKLSCICLFESYWKIKNLTRRAKFEGKAAFKKFSAEIAQENQGKLKEIFQH